MHQNDNRFSRKISRFVKQFRDSYQQPARRTKTPPPAVANIEQLEQRQLLSATSIQEIQSLPYWKFGDLAADEVVHLTADQVNSIPNRYWLSRVSGRHSLAATQVQALNVANTGIRELSESQRTQISLEQVQSLKYDEFGYLTGGQVASLTAAQTGSIPSSWWLSKVTNRSAMGIDQIQGLDIGNVGLRYLSAFQRGLLAVAQVQDVNYREFRYLDEHQTPLLTVEQLGAIDNSYYFAKMTTAARGALGGDQVRALDVSKISPQYLTSAQRVELSVAQIQSLSYRDFRYVNGEQSPHLTTDQLASITNGWYFAQMAADARAALSGDQVRALNTGSVSLQNLTIAQRAELSESQIQAIGYRDFRYVNADQSPSLTTAQLASITNGWYFSQMSADARAALTGDQVRALDVSNIDIRYLTAAQVSELSVEQVQSMNFRSFRYLGADQTPHLTADQLGAIDNVWYFAKMSAVARAALTVDQVKALDLIVVGTRYLTEAQLSSLNGTGVESLTYRDFQNLPVESVQYLSAEQLASIPNSWWLSQMKVEGITVEQVPALNIANVGIKSLNETQRAALTATQITQVTRHDFQYLTASQSPHLTTTQLQTLDSRWWLERLNADARAALTDSQVQALLVDKVGLQPLTASQRGAISTAQIQVLGYRDFEHLNASQIVHLTGDQIATIPNAWWFERITADARAALSTAQVQRLNTVEISLRGLTALQVSALTPAQVAAASYRELQYLGADQIVHATAEQLAAIPNSWWFDRISEDARAALSDSQVQAMNTAAVGLGGLTDSQVSALTSAQIAAVSYRELQHLGPDQIVHVTGEQLAAIPNSWWLSRISEESLHALSAAQVQSLNTANVSVKYLTAAQRLQLTTSQIQTLHYGDFRYLNAEQVTHLTLEQMGSIPNRWHFERMSHAARAAFSRAQLLSLQPQVTAGTTDQPAAFGQTGMGAMTGDGHDDHNHDAPAPTTGPHTDDPAKREEHLALFNLVPHEAATHVTIASGDWNDATIWAGGEVPGLQADVLITEGHVVRYNIVSTEGIDTIRVDGSFVFATDVETQLLVDTLIVDGKGLLEVGSDENPIDDAVTARIIIHDDGPVDPLWDPLQLSRGVISHGRVEIHGEDVTPYVSLSADPNRGDTVLNLDSVPNNWNVGDRLVLTGTNPWRNEDEELAITAISGTEVTVDRPLDYNHHTPDGYDFDVYVTNVNRNVVIMSERPELNDRRGHLMFMHSGNVDIDNLGSYGMGRTDKRNPANDSILDADGNRIEDTGLNQRGRYSLHFHRAGIGEGQSPATVTGSAVVDSPGWGFVNHQSFVHMSDNVAFNVVGASFVTEFGDERGSFNRNLSIRTTGSGDGIESREDIFDFGHQGDGFWFQGPLVESHDNISVGNAHAGFVFFTSSSMVRIDAEHVDPSLTGGRDSVPVGVVPLKGVSGDVAFANRRNGLETWFHMTNMNDGQSVIEGFQAWNNGGSGMHTPYTGRTTISNAVLVGNQDRPRGTAISRNKVTNQMTYDNVTVDGWEVGIDVPVRRTSVINDGTFNAVRAIEIHSARDDLREVDINGDIDFRTLTDTQLRGREQFDIFMEGGIPSNFRDLEVLFTPDIVRIGTVHINGKQIYYDKQAANYVPFAADNSPEWVPAELVGKTNAQLWSQYGIAPAGAVAPADAVEMDRINGLVGSPTEYQARLRLLSAKYTNVLENYELSYVDGEGNHVTHQPVTLDEGWNLLTHQVNGVTRTFFVFGDIEAPTFELRTQDMRVNPEGLEYGFTVRGTVFDNSFGHMSFKKKFTNLAELEVQTRTDGTQYLMLDFTIRDLAGNETRVQLELTLDPDAPLVPGTDQRDLPPREMPRTLLELLDWYYITNQEHHAELLLV